LIFKNLKVNQDPRIEDFDQRKEYDEILKSINQITDIN